MAAQALVGATLTHLVNAVFGFPRFDTARNRLQRDDPENVGLAALRLTALLHCLAAAIEHTKYAQPGFNRHSTAGHDAMFAQYSATNCLRGLLLLVGLLRELSLDPPMAV
jgi:hypothetical protein